jgi:cytoskeleton protein RodZ
MRAITLEEIAAATKIGTRSLKALEEEHFDQLPGGIFNKGFVRAYAKFLGIDEEQAVSDYEAATSDVGNSTVTQMAAMADQVERQRKAKEAENGQGAGTGAMLAAIVAIVVLCGIGFGGYKGWQYKKHQQVVEASAPIRRAPEAVTPAALSSTDANESASTGAAAGTTPGTALTPDSGATATPTPASGATTGSTKTDEKSAAAKSTTAPEFPINVTIRATKKAWLQVKSDGKNVFADNMDPEIPAEKERTFRGKENVQLVLGNAGGVEVSFNGKPLGTLGSEGQTRKLTITPEGIQK